MSKTNKILLGLLAVQLLLTGYLYRGNGRSVAPEMELLAGLSSEQVRKVVISEPDRSVVLLRDDQGWQVELAPGREYPADQLKVEALLARLAGLKSSRLVSRTRGSQARLKVTADQYNRKVELTGTGGSRTLFLGTAPSYQSIHARVGEGDEVYLVRDLALWEVPAEAAGWWQGRYLDQEPGELLAVELVNRQGRLRLERAALEEPWRLAEEATEVEAQKVTEFLEGISRLTINEVVADQAWQPEGMPEATLKLRTGSGEVELRIWPRPDENSDYPVKISSSPFFARAGGYALEGILNARAEELRGDDR